MTTPDIFAAAERYRKHLEAIGTDPERSPYFAVHKYGGGGWYWKRELSADEKLLARAYVERKPINGWELACRWYKEQEVAHSIHQIGFSGGPGSLPLVPADVSSREFATWLTEQYRLAMAKGIDIGQRGEA